MGFFSSRKAEDNDSYQVTIGVGGVSNEKSVVKVIRSRFYGKKGKEREDQGISYQSGAAAAAQNLTNDNPTPVASSPTASSKRSSGFYASLDRVLPSTPSKKQPREVPDSPSSPTPTRNKDPPSSLHVKAQSIKSSKSVSSPRQHTDTVTATLAQRLNELAVANSEGRLTDDEYRLLRQNLFERFSSSAAVPVEVPVVPAVAVARPRPKKGLTDPERATTRPLSNFQVELPRPSSIHSKTSVTSTMTSFFRRNGNQSSPSKDVSDASSMWSGTSNASNMFRLPRILSKKSSNSSIRTTNSRSQADAISISSRRMGSDKGEHGAPFSPGGARSTAGSIRRMAVPPSAFPSSFPSKSSGRDVGLSNPIYNVFDEGHLSTVQEITQEIRNVEAEAKRLMDAFNGLEITTLARAQRHHVRPSLKSTDFGKSSNSEWENESDGRSQKRVQVADDATSMRSGISNGTAHSLSASISRSGYTPKKGQRTKPLPLPSSLTINNNSRPGSLHRKNSSSSVVSERKNARLSIAPPVPALPHSITNGYLKAASSSNVSLPRSAHHLPMNTVLEDEKSVTASTVRLELEEDTNEMDDIRRRREEVNLRYEARLEYLRAKLKGAQLHEKLLRR